MVAQLSQNMNFLADMTVGDFLSLHAKCRGAHSKCVNAVVELANTLTGEPIKKEHDLTILSLSLIHIFSQLLIKGDYFIDKSTGEMRRK